jgi:CrcB protein
MTALLVALGAAAGAPARYLAGHYLDGRHHVGTFGVNVLGSFLLGWFVGLGLSESGLALLGVGFCGAFTTYSAFAVQTHDLGPRRGIAYAVATLALSLGAAAGGFALGS